MLSQSETNLTLSDKLDDICSELRFMKVVVRGALDILENEGQSAHELITGSKDNNADTAFDAMIASLLYINDNLNSLISICNS